MKKIISGFVFLTIFVFISGCRVSTQTERGWAQTLDLCQLAAWRPDAYSEINAACTGAAAADEVLIKQLAHRAQCLASDDFVSCAASSPAASALSEDETLNLSRTLALSQGEEQSALLEQISPRETGEDEWKNSWLGLWKNQLNKNGVLNWKYKRGILSKSWKTSEIDWLAFHAYSAENARKPKHQLITRVTLAVELANLGMYEEAALNLDKLSPAQMKRVLKPDLSLYNSTAPDFSSQDPQDGEQGASRAYCKTVAAIIAIQLQTNDKRAAKKTFEQAKPTLSLLTGGGDKYIDLFEFVLGKNVPNEDLFDKVFLGVGGYQGPYTAGGFAGLNGYESLVSESALAPVLKKRLDEMQSGLSGYDLKTARVEWNVPNMSDADFLGQPERLRGKLGYYKILLKDKIDPTKTFWRQEAAELKSPEHVSPVDERWLARIKKVGFGTRAREIEIIRQLNDPYSDQTIIIWRGEYFGGTILFIRDSSGDYNHQILYDWVS